MTKKVISPSMISYVEEKMPRKRGETVYILVFPTTPCCKRIKRPRQFISGGASHLYSKETGGRKLGPG